MFSKFAPKYAAVALSVVAALSLAGCKGEAPSAPKGPQEVGVVKVELSSPMITTVLSGRASTSQVAEAHPQISGIIYKRTFQGRQLVQRS